MDTVAKIEAARRISNELVGVRDLPLDSIRRYLARFGIQGESDSSSRRGLIRDLLTDASVSTLVVIAVDLALELGSGDAMQAQKFSALRADPQLRKDFDEYRADVAGLGLVFFDIDDFKRLNTKYTETVVDTDLLEPLTFMIEESVRGRGHGYSVGGDEFIILLRNTGQVEAVAFAQRLHAAVGGHEFHVNGHAASITLSMGVATFPHDAKTYEALRRMANQAENRAKQEGKNRIVTNW